MENTTNRGNLASPPLTPSINNSSENRLKMKKNGLNSSSTPSLAPPPKTIIGPNGQPIPILIADASGKLLPINSTKTKMKKSKSYSTPSIKSNRTGRTGGGHTKTKKKTTTTSPCPSPASSSTTTTNSINFNTSNPILSPSLSTATSTASYNHNSNPTSRNGLQKIVENEIATATPGTRLRKKKSSSSSFSVNSTSQMKKANRRQSLLIPLHMTSTPNLDLTMTTSTPNISSKNGKPNLPLFIVPTGKDGKIDPSLLPTPMPHSELLAVQKEYEESIYSGDNDSIILTPKLRQKKKTKKSKGKKSPNQVLSSNESFSSTGGNSFVGSRSFIHPQQQQQQQKLSGMKKSLSEAGEFININGMKGKNVLSNDVLDTASMYSLDVSNLKKLKKKQQQQQYIGLSSKQFMRSESSPTIGKLRNGDGMNVMSPVINDTASEYSSTNFSLRNIDANGSSSVTSFTTDGQDYADDDDDESMDIELTSEQGGNVNADEVFATLGKEKKDSAMLLKKKLDESIETIKRIKDKDLKYNHFNYISTNIQLLPAPLKPQYKVATLKLLKKFAVSSGHQNSLYLLGNLYVHGFPGMSNLEQKKFKPKYNKAFSCYFQAYKSGHQESSFNIAVCYELGLGTRVDLRRSLQIYQKTAATNHPGAMCRLGLACLNGDLNLHKNLKEAVRWLRLSTMYANEEYPQAYYHLATIYERGIPNIIIRDVHYAVQLLEKASALGHIQTNHKLGLCYEFGQLGLEVDVRKSLYYFGKAAAKGNAESMFELAGWYLTGSETVKENNGSTVSGTDDFILEPSDVISFQWTRKAAERNLPKAEYALGYFYENGIGVEADQEEAMKWYYVAYLHKDPKATQKMSEKSFIFWVNQFKSSELLNIETELYTKPVNYDLIEDEINLHFANEKLHQQILDVETVKEEGSTAATTAANHSSKDNHTNSPTLHSKNGSRNSSGSSNNEKCIVM